jgi:hypothetical protein
LQLSRRLRLLVSTTHAFVQSTHLTPPTLNRRLRPRFCVVVTVLSGVASITHVVFQIIGGGADDDVGV